jgi:hypothetical protein
MIDPFLLEALTQVDNNNFSSSNTSRWHVMFFHCPQPMCIFFHLNNSLGNKWFNLKIPSQSIDTIIPFLACSPTFWLSSLVFSIALRTQLGLLHPSITGILQCLCTHPIDPMGIHLLCYIHGNKCIGTHDVICDTFVTIAWDFGFHVGQE